MDRNNRIEKTQGEKRKKAIKENKMFYSDSKWFIIGKINTENSEEKRGSRNEKNTEYGTKFNNGYGFL